MLQCTCGVLPTLPFDEAVSSLRAPRLSVTRVKSWASDCGEGTGTVDGPTQAPIAAARRTLPVKPQCILGGWFPRPLTSATGREGNKQAKRRSHSSSAEHRRSSAIACSPKMWKGGWGGVEHFTDCSSPRPHFLLPAVRAHKGVKHRFCPSNCRLQMQSPSPSPTLSTRRPSSRSACSRRTPPWSSVTHATTLWYDKQVGLRTDMRWRRWQSVNRERQGLRPQYPEQNSHSRGTRCA